MLLVDAQRRGRHQLLVLNAATQLLAHAHADTFLIG